MRTPPTMDPVTAEAGQHENHRYALQAHSISKVYVTEGGSTVGALSDIDLQIAPGEALGILGPSGCGKSTLLRIFAGLDDKYSGRVQWETTKSPDRAVSATVFQGDSTFPWMTVRKNVEFGLSALRLPQKEARRRSAEYCALVGLQGFEDSYPHELSGGMRQRVAVARALATKPHLLLMDEPLAALDAQTRLLMQEELRRIWEQANVTVIYITHDIEEALSLVDRVVVLSARPGRICHTRANTPAAAGQSLTEMRSGAEFRQAANELWGVLRREIGKTLAVAPESPKARKS